MANLRELPGTRKYPSTTVLHAVCAVASFFSPLIEKVRPDLSIRQPYEVFVPVEVLEEEHSLATGSRIAFGLEQAVLTRAMIELDIRTGRQITTATTALMALCWYYVSRLIPLFVQTTDSTEYHSTGTASELYCFPWF